MMRRPLFAAHAAGVSRARFAARVALIALIALAAFVVPRPAGADGDRHALSASGERFEIVIASDAIAPGTQAPLDVYVSDFDTNAPVAGATIAKARRAEAARSATRRMAKILQ